MNEPPALPAASTAAAAKKTFRVLYVDDMRELRELARILLGRDGHSVECLEDGRVAFERLRETPDAFDLLITDHHMPSMNGLELLRRVRELPYKGKVIIFCSELSRDVNQAYRDLKVDEILYKPILPADLRKVLAAL
jgi:two-component system, chemotaxis family, chemotaxis protein CheY